MLANEDGEAVQEGEVAINVDDAIDAAEAGNGGNGGGVTRFPHRDSTLAPKHQAIVDLDLESGPVGLLCPTTGLIMEMEINRSRTLLVTTRHLVHLQFADIPQESCATLSFGLLGKRFGSVTSCSCHLEAWLEHNDIGLLPRNAAGRAGSRRPRRETRGSRLKCICNAIPRANRGL